MVRFLLICVCVLFFPVVLIVAFLPRVFRFKNRYIFFFVDLFYKMAVHCLFVPITFIKGDYDFSQPAIIIANHQSSIDIPLVGVLLNGSRHFWIARQELMDSFFLRYALPIFAQVIDVLNPRASAFSLRTVVRLAQKTDAHVVLFPEGSRSLDGQLQPLFDGYVWLAKQLNRPVVPIFIHDAYRVYPRGSFFVNHVSVHVVVGQPFFYNEKDQGAQLKSDIQAWLLKQQSNW